MAYGLKDELKDIKRLKTKAKKSKKSKLKDIKRLKTKAKKAKTVPTKERLFFKAQEIKERIKGKETAQARLSLKEQEVEKRIKGKEKLSAFKSNIFSNVSKGFKPTPRAKRLKKPKTKLKKISAKKLIKQMGVEQGGLVKEVPNPYANPPQDNRNLFFNQEYKYAKRKQLGGFL